MNGAATRLRFELNAQAGICVFDAQAHLRFAVERMCCVGRNVVPNGVLIHDQEGVDVACSTCGAVVRAFCQLDVSAIRNNNTIGKALVGLAPSMYALAPHIWVGCVVIEFNSGLELIVVEGFFEVEVDVAVIASRIDKHNP